MEKICPLYKAASIMRPWDERQHLEENKLLLCDKGKCGMWRRDYIRGEGTVEYCGMGGPDKL